MANFDSLPPPPSLQKISDKEGNATPSYQDWFFRLRQKLQELAILPPLGSSNQLLGVNSTATSFEYKTLAAGTGIGVAQAPGLITISNTGVTSLTGTANQIIASASTGAVTISLGNGTSPLVSLGVATNGQLPIGSTGSDPVLAALTPGSGISITNGAGSITVTNTSPGSGGTVTSVALADGSSTPIYNITGSPVTGSGTLTFTLATETANKVFAGPSSGAAAQPTFRSLATADVSSVSITNLLGTTNQVAVSAAVGTSTVSLAGPHNFTTETNHGILLGQGTSPIVATAVMTDGQLLVGQSAADPLPKTVSGDFTLAASGVATFATVNGNVGTFGDASNVPQLTVNAKGLVTAVTNVPISSSGNENYFEAALVY